jgi:release factor glutamine methyltransferase
VGNVAEQQTTRTLLAAAAAMGVDRLDAEALLGALVRRSRAQLIAFDEIPIDDLTAAMFHAGLDRRASGEPLAYITGIREFWSLPLVVSPSVLIPRPETELLVELCLQRFGTELRRVADLGTGSLAVAAALASERPSWSIVATDSSNEALAIATINRSRLKLANIELREGHWCAALDDAANVDSGTARFDAILGNPPYVDAGDPALLALAHEPYSALVAANEGYADLFAVAAGAREHLKPSGLLLLEHGTSQAPRLHAELVALGYARVVCHRDLAGHDRVTEAVWP